MARVTGIGGIFLKARDPKTLAAWYALHLSCPLADWGGITFRWSEDPLASAGSTTLAFFPAESKHFPNPAMINFRVDDLEKLLTQLRAANVTIDPKRDSDPHGLFAWITDPEGNRIELWQPLVPEAS